MVVHWQPFVIMAQEIWESSKRINHRSQENQRAKVIIQFFQDKIFISHELVREFGMQILSDSSANRLAF